MTDVLNDDVVKLVYCKNLKGKESGVRFPAMYRRSRNARRAANARWDFQRFTTRIQIMVLLSIVRRPVK